MMPPPFKTCPACLKPWESQESFLADPELEISGYQVNFADLEQGFFYFTHTAPGCGTTMAVPVGKFSNLSDRPFLSRNASRAENCPEICLRHHDTMSVCPVECECHWVRDILQRIGRRKKED